MIRQLVPHLKYLRYVLKHKWYVIVYGCKLEIPMRFLLLHDLSKFSREEWTPYVNKFYGGVNNEQEFKRAWHHHIRNNPHHSQYWVNYQLSIPISIPVLYVKEMVVDWAAAGKAQGQGIVELWTWFYKTKHKRTMHPESEELAEKLLYELVDKI